MSNSIKTIALIMLVNKHTHDVNGNLVAKNDFKIKLESGDSIYVSKGQDIVLNKEQIGIGTVAFKRDSSDGFMGSLLKGLGNMHASDINYIDWEEIKSIY